MITTWTSAVKFVLCIALALSSAVGVASLAGYVEITLQASAGDTITLPIKSDLSGAYSILWGLNLDPEKPSSTLVYFENGEMLRYPPQRFDLNTTTGSLTIVSPRVNDSGVYEAEITYENHAVQRFKFKLIVSVPHPIPSPDGPPLGLINDRRSHIAAVISCVLCVVAAIGLAVHGCVARANKLQKNLREDLEGSGIRP